MKRYRVVLGYVCIVFSIVAAGFFAFGVSDKWLHLFSAFWFLAIGVFLIWWRKPRSEPAETRE